MWKQPPPAAGSSKARHFLQSAILSLSPLVFSWLAARGMNATRLDPSDSPTPKTLAFRLRALLRDERLFHERLEQC